MCSSSVAFDGSNLCALFSFRSRSLSVSRIYLLIVRSCTMRCVWPALFFSSQDGCAAHLAFHISITVSSLAAGDNQGRRALAVAYAGPCQFAQSGGGSGRQLCESLSQFSCTSTDCPWKSRRHARLVRLLLPIFAVPATTSCQADGSNRINDAGCTCMRRQLHR
jgi:hypothetical protein